MSDKSISSDIELNYKRALLFLQLAIEQLRVVDQNASQQLHSFYNDRISFIFAHHIKAEEYQVLANAATSRARALLPLSHDFFDQVARHMSQVPPSQGKDLFWNLTSQSSPDQDKRQATAEAWPRSSESTLRAPPPITFDAFRTNPTTGTTSSRIGVIGQGKPASASEPTRFFDYCVGPESQISDGISSNIATHAFGPASARIGNHMSGALNRTSGSRAGSNGADNVWNPNEYSENTHNPTSPSNINTMSPWSESVASSSTVTTESVSLSHQYRKLQDWGSQDRLLSSLNSPNTFHEAGKNEPFISVSDTSSLALAENCDSKQIDRNGTWAHIAALAESKSSAPAPAPDSRLSLRTTQQTSLGTAVAKQTDTALKDGMIPRLSYSFNRNGREAFESQLRVVWLLNIPASYTALQISRHVTSGPLFSLSLEKDVAEHLPGISACIIFQFSTHAKEFLLSNECSVTFRDGGEVGQLPTPETSQNEGHRNKYHKDAASAVLQLGNPYPISSHADIFAKMLPPHMARRRVKWARARLFHSVPITTFKRDVLKITGSHELIELWHFYNPGECTVVFASVAVAIKVVDAFKHWSAGKGKNFPRKNIDEFEKIKVDGRYAGIEVAFCKDFNETPAGKLVSSYGSGNSASTRVSGYEGLFEGPKVKMNAL